MLVQKKLIVAAVILCATGAAFNGTAEAPPNELRAAVDKAIALVKPALVQIQRRSTS